MLGGIVRLVGMSGDVAATPDDAGFLAAPVPVVMDVISAVLCGVLGAFQLAPGFRLRRPRLHRCVWLTAFYPIPLRLQRPILFGVSLMIGTAMVAVT